MRNGPCLKIKFFLFAYNGDIMIKKILQSFKTYIKNHKPGTYTLLYSLLHSTLVYYCLELGNKNPLLNGMFYTFINILTVFALQSAIFIFVRRRWIAALVSGIPLTVLSIANYYTLMFRNSPISTQDIHNAGTALSVMESYSFPLTAFVIGIIVFFILQVLTIIQLYRHEKCIIRSLKSTLLKNAGTALLCVLFIHLVYFAENPIKPRNTFVWSWEDSYYKYGYAASSIEVFQKLP